MPNEKNLMPIQEVNSRRTPEQHSEDSRKAGIASGVSRRRKRSLKNAADYYLSLPVADRRSWNRIARRGVDPEDIDNQMAMIVGLHAAAADGDAKAAKVLIDLLGVDDAENAENGVQIIDDM
jgi:hypothetical protein